jgi:hypothetical protein
VPEGNVDIIKKPIPLAEVEDLTASCRKIIEMVVYAYLILWRRQSNMQPNFLYVLEIGSAVA